MTYPHVENNNNSQNNNNQTNKNKPINRIRDGALACSLFRGTSKEGREYYSISFQKSRKQQDGAFKTESVSFFGEELLKASNLLKEAYDLYLGERNSNRAKSTLQTQINGNMDDNGEFIEEFNDEVPF